MKLNIALGSLAGGNLLLGLLIQWYVVTRLGVGAATNALFAGMVVPQVVLAVVSGSLMHVLVPPLDSPHSLLKEKAAGSTGGLESDRTRLRDEVDYGVLEGKILNSPSIAWFSCAALLVAACAAFCSAQSFVQPSLSAVSRLTVPSAL